MSHILSADSIVPQFGNPMAWDRYAYINNNPVNGTDPTGRFIVPVLFYMYASSIGWLPDVIGIAKVYAATELNGVSIEVAAGLSVQGEYAGPIDDLEGDLMTGESGYGLAQVGPIELSARGLENTDPHDPTVATQVMQTRIQEAQDVCNGCDDFNMLVAAGIGQNGYISLEEISDSSTLGNWNGILRKPDVDLMLSFTYL